MRHSTKLSLALVTVGVFALSACGNSTAKLLDSTSTKTKNAALDDNSGLNVKAMTYNYDDIVGREDSYWGAGLEDQIPRDEKKLNACPEGTPTSIPNIDNDSLSSIENACQGDFYVVHYTGFITVPGNVGDDVAVNFKVAKDDGFSLAIDGNSVIDTWNVSSCSWVEGSTTLKAGQKYPLDAWFYEYRGGVCNQMTWSLDGAGFDIVPQSALSRVGDATEETTTTIAEEVTQTTVAEEETSTTIAEEVTQTTVAEEETSTTIADEATVSNAIVKTDDKTVTIEADATNVNCDNACYAAIAASLGATDGPVYVSVDGGERIAIDGADFSKIAVGKDAKKLIFSTLVDGVSKETTFDLNRSAESPASSSSNSNNLLWLLILVAVMLGGGGYAYSRKKK
jgi:hypothetical protein